MSDDTLLTFPCDFMIKVFGTKSEEFEIAVLTIIRKHVPDFSDTALRERLSAKGKYSAISVTVHVHSKEQLDDIYRELSSSPSIIMVL